MEQRNAIIIDKCHRTCHISSMRAKARIDSAGRVVIPKKLRIRYGFEIGKEVEIVPLPDGISIIPERIERRYVRQDRVLSIETGTGTADIETFDVSRLRDEYLATKNI